MAEISDGSLLTETDRLLTDDLGVIEIDGRLTCSFEDALSLVKAFSVDLPDRGDLGYGIPTGFMIATRDLSEQISAHPWAGFSDRPESWNGLDFARAIALEVFDENAHERDFTSFEDQWRASSEDDPHFQLLWRLFDGGLVYDTDSHSSNREPLTWQGLLDKYKSDDPVVAEYFSRFLQGVRVDLSKLLQYFAPFPLFVNEKDVEVTVAAIKKFGSFLLSHGHELQPAFSVIHLDQEGPTDSKRTTTKAALPPPKIRPAWLDKPL
jgi:hypothetical protein